MINFPTHKLYKMSTYELNGQTIRVSDEEVSHFRIIATEYTDIFVNSLSVNIWSNSIRKVDNIACEAHIYYDNFSKTFCLELNDGNVDFTEKKIYFSCKLLNKIFQNKTDITVDDMIDALVNMKQRLSTMKFDKCSGKFNNVVMSSLYEVFKDCGNIELNIKECCVCYTHTIDKTICGHSLCIPCFQALKLQYIQEEDITCRSCPICRRAIERILP
jgi:hypothetical protein